MKLIITNLPWSFTAQDLEALFSNYCIVKNSRIIYDQNCGYSLGYGFVVIPKDKVNLALHHLNGRRVNGNCITVVQHPN